MLMHFVRTASGETRERGLRILRTPRKEKDPGDIDWLLGAMIEAGSLEHARAMAHDYSERAIELDAREATRLRDNDDRRFLREMLRYVIDRLK